MPGPLFAYWHQGRDEAPELVQVVLDRWARLHPDRELRVLDAGDARRLLADSPLDVDRAPIPSVADLLRARILLAEGGTWVDSTLLPVVPLDTWLPEQLTGSGFFTFSSPQPDRPIVNWFLAADRPGHPLLERLCEEFDRYWSTPRNVVKRVGVWPGDSIAAVSPGTESDPAPYFWFHYLFGRLVEVDPTFADLWSATPKRTADPCFALWRASRHGEPDEATLARLLVGSPVHKLTLTKASYPLPRLREVELDPAAIAPLVPSPHLWTPATAHAVPVPDQEREERRHQGDDGAGRSDGAPWWSRLRNRSRS